MWTVDLQTMLSAGQVAAAHQRLADEIIRASNPRQSAREAAQALAELYDGFATAPVEAFVAEGAPLANEAIEAIGERLGAPLARTRHWRETLPGVTRERLARECRRAIVTRDFKEATRLAAALLALAGDDEERLVAHARYLSSALATLYRDRDRAAQVIEMLSKATPAARHVAEHFAFIVRRGGDQQAFETGEHEWRRQQLEAVVSLQAFLPTPTEAGEPEPVQVERFESECRSLLRAALGQSQPEQFIDALTILLEYCPAEASRVANAAGVEDRMFVRLGPRARLTSVRALARLGESAPLRRELLALVGQPAGQGRLALMSGIFGGLRHSDFLPYLRQQLAEVETERDEELVVDALSRVGSPEAVELLLDRLAFVIRRTTEPVFERLAYMQLAALGRLARGRGLETGLRNRIVRRVMELSESEARHLAFTAATEMVSVRVTDLDPDLRGWAARKIVAAMWGPEPAYAGAVGAGAAGWRAPMVGALVRLGPEVLPAVLEEAAVHGVRYSGAMGALAEVLQAIGDERALELLGSMVRVAFLHREDPRQAQLMGEKIRDAATDQMRPLDRDDVIHTLLYTIQKIGNQAGTSLLLEFADQVQAGRLESPGTQTNGLLLDVKLKDGSLGEVSRRAEPTPAPAVDEAQWRAALSTANGWLLTPREKRIAAMVLLGQSRRPEAVPVLLRQLGARDRMVASSAHAALAVFLNPLPALSDYEDFLLRILENQQQLKGQLLDRLIEFIGREIPKRPPYDRVFERALESSIDDGQLLHRLRAAMRRDAPAPPRPELQVKSVESPAEAPSQLSELDRRRAQFHARKRGPGAS